MEQKNKKRKIECIENVLIKKPKETGSKLSLPVRISLSRINIDKLQINNKPIKTVPQKKKELKIVLKKLSVAQFVKDSNDTVENKTNKKYKKLKHYRRIVKPVKKSCNNILCARKSDVIEASSKSTDEAHTVKSCLEKSNTRANTQSDRMDVLRDSNVDIMTNTQIVPTNESTSSVVHNKTAKTLDNLDNIPTSSKSLDDVLPQVQEIYGNEKEEAVLISTTEYDTVSIKMDITETSITYSDMREPSTEMEPLTECLPNNNDMSDTSVKAEVVTNSTESSETVNADTNLDTTKLELPLVSFEAPESSNENIVCNNIQVLNTASYIINEMPIVECAEQSSLVTESSKVNLQFQDTNFEDLLNRKTPDISKSRQSCLKAEDSDDEVEIVEESVPTIYISDSEDVPIVETLEKKVNITTNFQNVVNTVTDLPQNNVIHCLERTYTPPDNRVLDELPAKDSICQICGFECNVEGIHYAREIREIVAYIKQCCRNKDIINTLDFDNLNFLAFCDFCGVFLKEDEITQHLQSDNHKTKRHTLLSILSFRWKRLNLLQNNNIVWLINKSINCDTLAWEDSQVPKNYISDINYEDGVIYFLNTHFHKLRILFQSRQFTSLPTIARSKVTLAHCTLCNVNFQGDYRLAWSHYESVTHSECTLNMLTELDLDRYIKTNEHVSKTTSFNITFYSPKDINCNPKDVNAYMLQHCQSVFKEDFERELENNEVVIFCDICGVPVDESLVQSHITSNEHVRSVNIKRKCANFVQLRGFLLQNWDVSLISSGFSPINSVSDDYLITIQKTLLRNKYKDVMHGVMFLKNTSLGKLLSYFNSKEYLNLPRFIQKKYFTTSCGICCIWFQDNYENAIQHYNSKKHRQIIKKKYKVKGYIV